MAIRGSSAPQVAALVQDLVGSDPIRREAAVARLAIAGVRAVDPLLRALPQATPIGQAAILRALELIASPRTLQPALTHLSSVDTAVAIAAVGAVRPHLQSSDPAAASAALDALTALALDRSRAETIRVASLGALSDLGETVLGVLRTRLQSEERARVRRAAGLDGPAEADVELAAARLEAVVKTGERDPELVRRLLSEAGSEVSLSALHELVLYLRERERATKGDTARAAWEAARGAAHQALSERGSRLALFDLREALADIAPARLSPFLQTAEAIGDASCVEGLAAAWQRSAAGEPRDRIAEAFRAIVKREGLTKRHATVKRALARVPELASSMR